MQVLLINGSPHPKGSTATALATVAQQLEKAGIETTTLHVGTRPSAAVSPAANVPGPACASSRTIRSTNASNACVRPTV